MTERKGLDSLSEQGMTGRGTGLLVGTKNDGEKGTGFLVRARNDGKGAKNDGKTKINSPPESA